jgi:hypothetical protein
MYAFLVIERPDHSPRVLGVFRNRGDAEEARALLLADEPSWVNVVSVRASQQTSNGRSARGLVAVWLVALFVDVMLLYGLYVALRALGVV